MVAFLEVAAMTGSDSYTRPKQPDALGQPPERTASQELGLPVPYFAGKRRLAARWLCEVIDQKAVEATEETESGGGKGGGGSEERTVGWDYYATVAAVFAHGPVDELEEIWIDGERVWHAGEARGEGEDSVEIDVEGYGTLRLYWGTETQEADPALENHPAYRGQCYGVFEDWYFGRDRTTAPNIELTLARKPVVPEGMGAQGTLYGWEVNPVHVLAELLTNKRYGLGFSPAALDLPAFETAAERVQDMGMAVSPLLAERQDASGLCAKICEYFDGWMSSGADGPLAVHVAGAPGDPASYPLLGEYDLTERPKIESESWNETVNEVAVQFTDRRADYSKDTELWRSKAAMLATGGEPAQVSVDRPWITKRDVAGRYAARYGRLQSVPRLTARITARKASVYGVEPGGFVRLTYQGYVTTLLMRVQQMTWPDADAQAVELDLATDRYTDAILDYQPDDPAIVESELIDPVPLHAVKFVELPRALADDFGQGSWLGVLAARADAYTSRVQVWGSDDGADFVKLGGVRSFARTGTLAYAWNGYTYGNWLLAPDGFDIIVNMDGHDRDWPAEAGSERAWLGGRFLVFINDEIVTYKTATLAGNLVTLHRIRRGLGGTPRQAHAAGSRVFMVRRADLPAVRLKPQWESGESIEFRAVSGTAAAMMPLSSTSGEEVEVMARRHRPHEPSGVRVNGDSTSPLYSTGEDITIRWDETYFRAGEGFWARWDSPEDDPWRKALVVILTADGLTVKRKIKVGAGSGDAIATGKTVYSNAQLVADFGGEPSSFAVRVYGRRQGWRSERYAGVTVNKAAPGYGTTPGLRDILRVIDPATVMQKNWDAIAAHWPTLVLPYPSTVDASEEDAPAQIDANFEAISAAGHINPAYLQPVAIGNRPRLRIQANIDAIRSAW
jgi:hypothetical protein